MESVMSDRTLPWNESSLKKPHPSFRPPSRNPVPGRRGQFEVALAEERALTPFPNTVNPLS